MPHVLVTGGSGFFGDVLKHRLVAEGFTCVNFDLLPDAERLPGLESIQGDLRDTALLAKVFQEQRFDARENSGMRRNNDVTGGEISSFHEFLEGHSTIAGELSKNPSLATNQEYLENHPALRSYLKSNPNVHEELTENPQSFVKSAQQGAMPAKGVPKTMTTDPKMK